MVVLSASIDPLFVTVTIYSKFSPAFTLPPSPIVDSSVASITASLPVSSPIFVAIVLSSIVPVLLLF